MSDRQNDRPEEGGLFSEEYEAPKRENPYLKKNRARAEADRPARAKPSAPAEAEDGRRRRTFSDWMFEHVKLIAAIATICVILTLVLVTDVVEIVGDLVAQSQQADKEDLTLTYVKGLSEKSAPISWEDLDRFKRDETDAKDSVTWMIPVEGGQYEIWISGPSVQKSPAYVYLFDLESGDKLVLGEEDFDLFIREHTKK